MAFKTASSTSFMKTISAL